MPAIKSISVIAKKWGRVTPGRAEDFKIGVETTTKDWEKNTKAAESLYDRGVQQAITEKRFGKGVSAAGTAKWKEKTLLKGVTRWPEGVAVAQPDYEKGFAPIRDAIERTTLPPPGTKLSPQNFERVKVMAMAISKAAKR